MAGEENLIPMSERSKEEVREIARRGGIKSGETRRRKNTMKENLELLLTMSVGKGEKADIENGENIKDYAKENVTVEQAMLIAQIQKALKGDAQAFEMIRDLIGEKPVDKKEVSASVQHDNPFEGLTTEELKKLIDDE